MNKVMQAYNTEAVSPVNAVASDGLESVASWKFKWPVLKGCLDNTPHYEKICKVIPKVYRKSPAIV